MDTYIKDLRRVLNHLSAAGFTLHGSKYFLGISKTTHLGFEYSADGATLWPVPKNSKDLRSFLCLANFYLSFVPQFAHIPGPLNSLMGKNFQFT